MLKKNQYIWIYGYHSVINALKNSKRDHEILLITENNYKKYCSIINVFKNNVDIKIVHKDKITELFPQHTNHQNITLYTSIIPNLSLEQIIEQNNKSSTILMLDQITDTGNIGAILRSAAAFSVDAVILTKNNSPDLSTISKTASGTLESVPLIYVNNLTNAIKYAQKNGYWCYGMDEKAETLLHQVKFDEKRIIILGSENSGMRRLTKENCDHMVRIPISENIDSLNVSNAAAIILYSLYINF